MTYDDAVKRSGRSQKDSDQSPFVVAGRLMEPAMGAVKVKASEQGRERGDKAHCSAVQYMFDVFLSCYRFLFDDLSYFFGQDVVVVGFWKITHLSCLAFARLFSQPGRAHEAI